MTKRAWWLVGLNLILPGSAQLVAGNRRLGRVGVATTFVLWAAVLLAVIVGAANREALLSLATNAGALVVLQVVLVGYAILWIVLSLDTLRLTRLIRVGPRARPAVALVAILALIAVAGTAGYGAASAGSARSAISHIFIGSKYAQPVNGRYNILLLGGDAGPDRLGLRPDSTSVASVDAVTGATTIIGIPRNTEQVRFVKGSPLWGPFPNGYDCGDQCLIDYLYTYGEEHPQLYPKAVAEGSQPGIEAMRDATEGMLGLTVQYYALIDMQGFSDLVDALGGVTVDVPNDLPYGPITAKKPYGVFRAGVQHFNGYDALWYARSRFDGKDYDRMARQRQVEIAIAKQFQPAIILTKFQAIAGAGAQVVKSDIPPSLLSHLVTLADKGRKLPVTQLALVPPEYIPAQPDYARILQAVRLATRSSAPSPTPSP
jgi:polyisoprenyl-teichoic acid--peptidoglycan teichoic acid transferase